MFKKTIFQNTVNKHRTQTQNTEHKHMLKTVLQLADSIDAASKRDNPDQDNTAY